MPEVAKTLPDPLHSAAADSGPNADELLSQLAGDEIDRLLAEADVSRSEPPAPVEVPKQATKFQPTAKTPPPDPSADPDLNKQLDDLFNQLNQEVVEAPAAPAPVAAPAAPAPPVPEPPAPVVAQTAQAEPPKPAVAEAPPVVAADPAGDTHSLQEDVLAATALAGIPEAPIEKKELPPAEPVMKRQAGERPLSLFLRAATAISRLLPETILDWMGKAAILTTINAMAIFVYVLIRRH